MVETPLAAGVQDLTGHQQFDATSRHVDLDEIAVLDQGNDATGGRFG